MSGERSSAINDPAATGHADQRLPSPTVSTESLSEEERATVEQNLALVHHIVARLTQRFPASRSRDDLVQVGALGLIEAVRRFDPSRQVGFSTFAGRRIEGAVLDALRSDDWASRSVRRGERNMLAAGDKLRAVLGRRPTDLELSQSMRVEIQQVRALRADLARARVESLDRRVHPTERRTAIERLDGPSQETGDELLEQREILGYLRDAVRLLPERHRLVIIGHFIEGRTMTELGDLLGVTQSRASQLKGEALTMMRDGMSAVMGDHEPVGEPLGRQRQYREALVAASSWRQRLTSTNPTEKANTERRSAETEPHEFIERPIINRPAT